MPVSTRSSLARRIQDIIKERRTSREGHDSTRQPFFAGDQENPSVPRNTMTRDQRECLKKLIREVPFDANFLQFYITFCTEVADASTEFYYNRYWTFMSLYRVMEQLKHYRDNGQRDLIDLRFHRTWGHIMKFSYILALRPIYSWTTGTLKSSNFSWRFITPRGTFQRRSSNLQLKTLKLITQSITHSTNSSTFSTTKTLITSRFQ